VERRRPSPVSGWAVLTEDDVAATSVLLNVVITQLDPTANCTGTVPHHLSIVTTDLPRLTTASVDVVILFLLRPHVHGFFCSKTTTSVSDPDVLAQVAPCLTTVS